MLGFRPIFFLKVFCWHNSCLKNIHPHHISLNLLQSLPAYETFFIFALRTLIRAVRTFIRTLRLFVRALRTEMHPCREQLLYI